MTDKVVKTFTFNLNEDMATATILDVISEYVKDRVNEGEATETLGDRVEDALSAFLEDLEEQMDDFETDLDLPESIEIVSSIYDGESFEVEVEYTPNEDEPVDEVMEVVAAALKAAPVQTAFERMVSALNDLQLKVSTKNAIMALVATEKNS